MHLYLVWEPIRQVFTFTSRSILLLNSYFKFLVSLQACISQNVRQTSSPTVQGRWRRQSLNRTNLGELERFAGPEQSIESPIITQPLTEFVAEPRFDGPTAIVSILLFLILVSLGADRILGLSRFVKKGLVQWKEQRAYERRAETIEARARLENAFKEGEDNEPPGSGPGKAER